MLWSELQMLFRGDWTWDILQSPATGWNTNTKVRKKKEDKKNYIFVSKFYRMAFWSYLTLHFFCTMQCIETINQTQDKYVKRYNSRSLMIIKEPQKIIKYLNYAYLM